MSDELNDVLGPDSDDELLAETTRSMSQERPVPSPAFRGDLARLLRLVGLVRPVAHWRAKALALAVAGALLLGAAGVGVAGGGPLAPTQLTSAPRSATPSGH